MEYIIGAALGLGIPLAATAIGLDRDRALYPVMTIVTASYYDLFALLGGAVQALGWDSVMMLVFIAAAVVGFKTSLWIVAAALAAHGLLDLVHVRLIFSPGVPTWWPMFCLTYDLFAASYLALLLWTLRLSATPGRSRSR